MNSYFQTQCTLADGRLDTRMYCLGQPAVTARLAVKFGGGARNSEGPVVVVLVDIASNTRVIVGLASEFEERSAGSEVAP